MAAFTVGATSPGVATAFDASSSTVRFGTIASYAWNFGDGQTDTTSSPTTTHVYPAPGSYQATVTETDSDGTSVSGEVYTGQSAASVGGPSAQTSRKVVVTNAPAPAVALSATSLDFGSLGVGAPSGPLSVTFSNTGSAALHPAQATVSGPATGGARGGGDLSFEPHRLRGCVHRRRRALPTGWPRARALRGHDQPPSGSTLSQGSRVADVLRGQTTDALIVLVHNVPLPAAVGITSGLGSADGSPAWS